MASVWSVNSEMLASDEKWGSARVRRFR